MGIERSPYKSRTYIYGQGNQSTQHKTKSVMTDAAIEIQQNAVDDVKDVVTAPFNFLKWCYENWQLTLIGVVAICVLLKD